MKKSCYTEEQIVGVLKESVAGMATAERCRKHARVNSGHLSPAGWTRSDRVRGGLLGAARLLGEREHASVEVY